VDWSHLFSLFSQFRSGFLRVSSETNRIYGVVAGISGGSRQPTSPPVANADSGSQPCWQVTTKNVTANDTDADGNYPLTVLSASSGTAINVGVASASSLQIESFGTKGTFPVTYTIQDSLGATATGTLSVTVTGTAAQCSAPQQLQALPPDSSG
jgi:hypothetical protein